MNLNKTLITKARNVKSISYEDLEELIKRYTTACFLSTGPIASRSAFWEMKAFERERELMAIIPVKART